MPTTQEAPTMSPIGRSTPRVDGPLKVSRNRRSTPPTSTFPGCSMPFRSKRRSPTAAWSSSTRPRPRKCPACERFFIARTSERSSARSWDRGSKASSTSVARRSRTMSFATTANTSRSPWRTRSRPPKPRPMRFAPPTPRRSRTSTPTSKPTTSPTWLPPRSARPSACKASAAMPRALSQPRRSSSTRPMSRRPRRTTPSSCTRRPRSGMDRR